MFKESVCLYIAVCAFVLSSVAFADANLVGYQCYEPSELEKKLAFLDTNAKPVDKLEKWISCYKTVDRNNKGQVLRDYHSDYEVLYKPYIVQAAKSFGIPQSYLTCLLFRESSHWRAITSPVGALGAAQLMPETIGDIDKYIGMTVTDGSVEQLAMKIQDFNENVSSKEVLYHKAVLLTRTIFNQLNTEWAHYFTELNKYTGKPVLVPRDFDLAAATRPREAVAAAAYYTKMQMHFLAEAFLFDNKYEPRAKTDPIYIKGQMLSPIDFAMISSAAYNWGLGAVKSAFIKNPLMQNYQDFSTSWKSGITQETVNHMASIANCMGADNWNPPSGTPIRTCQ